MKLLGELEAAGHVGTERFKRWWSSLQLVFVLCNRFWVFFFPSVCSVHLFVCESPRIISWPPQGVIITAPYPITPGLRVYLKWLVVDLLQWRRQVNWYNLSVRSLIWEASHIIHYPLFPTEFFFSHYCCDVVTCWSMWTCHLVVSWLDFRVRPLLALSWRPHSPSIISPTGGTICPTPKKRANE